MYLKKGSNFQMPPSSVLYIANSYPCLFSDHIVFTEEKAPELFVECKLYIDDMPFGLPAKTRYASIKQTSHSMLLAVSDQSPLLIISSLPCD